MNLQFQLLPVILAAFSQPVRAVLLDGNGNPLPIYSPLRPPAFPLAVRTPYSSVWSPTSGLSTLNSQNPTFWTGAKVGWEGIVVVDDMAYEYLGSGAQILPKMPDCYDSAKPITSAFDSQYSNFTFTAGPVSITASFFSPITPQDNCRSSLPLSYLSTSVESTDNQTHRIRFYSDINGAWFPYGSGQLQWDLLKNGQSVDGTENVTDATGAVYSWQYWLADPIPFREKDDLPRWGTIAYSTATMDAANFSFESGHALDTRYNFLQRHGLVNSVNKSAFREADNKEPIFAFVHDFGNVSIAHVRYTIGSIQEPIMKYLNPGGVTDLDPWWKHSGATCSFSNLSDMISFHWNDFETAQRKANDFETKLKDDIDQFYNKPGPATPAGSSPSGSYGDGPSTTSVSPNPSPSFDTSTGWGNLNPDTYDGESVSGDEAFSYYGIVALSARQALAAFVYAAPPPSSIDCKDADCDSYEPLMFMKEISSDGNVNTIDVLYPATPFLLYANPELLKYALRPTYEYQEGHFYPNDYTMHDLGSGFPNATGHTDGIDEYMPVEESGNFILMAYAYYKFSGNAAWLKSRYDLLKQFSKYLVEFALKPASQVSTDDFAGPLTLQANLAIKGIIALHAMAAIANISSNDGEASRMWHTAQDYYDQWEYYAMDPSRKHTVLGYQWRSSWGLLYNVYFDKLLNLGLVNQSLYTMQSNWYASVSQIYGVPLDNRHAYTKSDWEMWAAATCNASTRALMVNAVAYWLNNTPTGAPFTDLYDTISGDFAEGPFKARPVVGGHFSLLALGKSGQYANNEAGDTTGSKFQRNDTGAM